MTVGPQPLEVWVQVFPKESGFAAEPMMASLAETGIAPRYRQPRDTAGPGIVISPELSDRLCRHVQVISRSGTERVLVLLAPEPRPPDGAIWRVLAHGASDLLVWKERADLAQTIAGRLRRWREIDDLVESPLVKNHLVGESAAWKSLLRQTVELARFTDFPVLLAGETGTGKELAARLIHTLDQRRHERPLVVVDCTTIVPDLSGSELFGHERGAFTGAVAARDGACALADGGTLFLDEVGELSLVLQTQFLRVLQERTYKRVGGNVWRPTDFRLICATNCDLQAEVGRGHFRLDLYHRVAASTITLPPLRERVHDVVPLARHFVQEMDPSREPVEFEDPVASYLAGREYPGNVRDLKNLVHRLMARHAGAGPLTVGDVPPEERPAIDADPGDWCDGTVEEAIRRAIRSGVGLRQIKQDVIDSAIRIAVEETGNLQRAAQMLAVTDRALQKRRANGQARDARGTDLA